MTVPKMYYKILRVFLTLSGIIIVVFTYSSHFIMPGLYYDNSPIPPIKERILNAGLPFLYAILLIVPHRYTVNNLAFYIKMSLLLIASCWMVLTGLNGIIEYLQGGKHWGILLTSMVALAISAVAPFTLFTKRKFYLEQTHVSHETDNY